MLTSLSKIRKIRLFNRFVIKQYAFLAKRESNLRNPRWALDSQDNYMIIWKRANHNKNQLWASARNSGMRPDFEDNIGIAEYISYQLREIRHHYSSRGRFLFITVAGICFSTGFYLYVFGEEVREKMVDEVSTVASKTLEDDKLLYNAEQLSKDVVARILHDNEIKEHFSQFITNTLSSTETLHVTKRLLINVVESEAFVESVQNQLKIVTKNIVEDEEIKKSVALMLHTILSDEETRKRLQTVLITILNKPEVQSFLAEFSKYILSTQPVTNQGCELGRTIANKVLADAQVQQTAGDALWSSMLYSVTPSFLRSTIHSKGADNNIKDLTTNDKKEENFHVNEPVENISLHSVD